MHRLMSYDLWWTVSFHIEIVLLNSYHYLSKITFISMISIESFQTSKQFKLALILTHNFRFYFSHFLLVTNEKKIISRFCVMHKNYRLAWIIAVRAHVIMTLVTVLAFYRQSHMICTRRNGKQFNSIQLKSI